MLSDYKTKDYNYEIESKLQNDIQKNKTDILNLVNHLTYIVDKYEYIDRINKIYMSIIVMLFAILVGVLLCK